MIFSPLLTLFTETIPTECHCRDVKLYVENQSWIVDEDERKETENGEKRVNRVRR
jgi:hypothetical protein